MTKNKRIDIMLPYWGEFNLLKKTVDSVLAQTSDAWHLTILDDHYPSTEAEAYFTSPKDPRITYIRHEKNIGITNNFNFAIERVTAPYCVIVGCDDQFLPQYVETALKHIGEADFYQPGVDVIDSNDKSYLPLVDRVKRILQPKRSGIYSGEQLAASLCRGNWLYFPSIVWKTSTLTQYRFDPTYKIAEDVVVELDMIKDGATLYFDTTTTFQYRRSANSLSSKEKGKGGVRFGEEAAAYEHFVQEFHRLGWKKAARAAHLRLTSRLHELMAR